MLIGIYDPATGTVKFENYHAHRIGFLLPSAAKSITVMDDAFGMDQTAGFDSLHVEGGVMYSSKSLMSQWTQGWLGEPIWINEVTFSIAL